MKAKFLEILNKNKKIVGCDIKVEFMDQVICTDEMVEYEYPYSINHYKVFTSKLLNRQLIDLMTVNFEDYLNDSSYQEYFNRIIDGQHPAYQYFEPAMWKMLIIECENPSELNVMLSEVIHDNEYVFIRNSDLVVMLVERNDIHTFALETMNSIEVVLMQKATLVYSDDFKDVNEISAVFEACYESLQVGKAFNKRIKVLSVHDNTIEKLLSYLNETKRAELLISYPELETLNSEEMQTISYLFDNNLNITKTAKALYIHRNTLVYRIDKINKKMNLDIQNFNDALLLKLLMILRKIEK